MEITRVLTRAGEKPFEHFEWEEFHAIIEHHKDKGKDGKAKRVLDMPGISAPKGWSAQAKNTFVDKYFLKNGVPEVTCAHEEEGVPHWLRPRRSIKGCNVGPEQDFRQVIHRLVGHWTYTGFKNGYFAPSEKQRATRMNMFPNDVEGQGEAAIADENAMAFYNELCYAMSAQMFAPNSPQFFNTGLWWAYGIEGTNSGHWYVESSANTKLYAVPTLIDQSMSIDVWNHHFRQQLKQSETSYRRTQAHACFILAVEDTICRDNGITDWWSREARIFKYGSGSGANLSKLRGRNEPLSHGGVSSGMMSWANVGDRVGGAIKSGGTTRRAAKMICLDLDHPDIMEFITCKTEAEISVASLIVGSNAIKDTLDPIMAAYAYGKKHGLAITQEDVEQRIEDARTVGVPDNYIEKAITLGKLGQKEWIGQPYDYDYTGRAYSLAQFQNANNSVRVPSSFYKIVDKDGDWRLTFRKGGGIAAEMKARELEYAIGLNCWMSGDPGVQFDTTINEWNQTPHDGRIEASNPCSEHVRPNGSACNLASLRLTAFWHKAKGFLVEHFRHVASLGQMVLDITNQMSHLPDRDTAIGVFNWRDTGLGFMDLGGLLMSFGLPYGSPQARAVAGAITGIMCGEANLTSAMLARELGSYPRWTANKMDDLRVCRNHMHAFDGNAFENLTIWPISLHFDDLVVAVGGELASTMRKHLEFAWKEAYAIGQEFGFRNAEKTVIAPTGTISIITDCDSSGCEPTYSLVTYKEFVGGGIRKMMPARSVRLALEKIGYGEARVKSILAFIGENNRVPVESDGVDYFVNEEHRPIFYTASGDGEGKSSLSWKDHIDMMAAIQPFICGAISKTVNMPSSATVEDIIKANRYAHDQGIKAVAIYRDLSKLSAPLSKKIEKRSKAEVPEVPAVVVAGPRLEPETPPGGRVRLTWNRTPGFDVRVKIGPGNLYLRTTRYPTGKCAEIWATYSADQGIIQALLSTLCRTANISLQWGIPLEEIVATWEDSNFEPNGITGDHPFIKTARSIVNLMGRLLAYHELGDQSVLNVLPQVQMTEAQQQVVTETIGLEPKAYGKVRLTGETCSHCGSILVITSGSNCKKCLDCGNSGGCG